MILSPVQLFLILLNEGDPQSHYGIKYYFKKHFGEDPPDFAFLHKALFELQANDVIAEYDLETDGGVDLAVFSHPEHGNINFSEFEVADGIDEVFHLSRGALKFAMENLAELTDEAARHGFDKALKTVTSLPIDSTAWTGMPKGFVFTEETKALLLENLQDALRALESSGLSNYEVGQGAGLLKAAIALVETPDPPKDEIWSLLSKGATLATIASFFDPIVKLIRTIAN